MKTHAIIPIFIPHRGCPNDCVFCNQRRITSKLASPTEPEVRNTIDKWLTTLGDVPHVHIAFYGGSFTAIPMDEQEKYLKIAHEYKTSASISEIHLSTRPDCIDDEILDNLTKYGVDLIELGCQSFDNDVLAASKRGHSTEDIYKACSLIQNAGIKLGIQLMVGLPKSTCESDILSAQRTVEIMPDVARIYPTIVIEDTELLDMVKSGEYKPLTIDDAIWRSKEMLKVLNTSGVNVIRIGLKASDLISGDGKFTGTTFHPAFRQLVEGEIAKEEIERQLESLIKNLKLDSKNSKLDSQNSELDSLVLDSNIKILCSAHPSSFSNLIGNGGRNKKYFIEKYKNWDFSYKADESIPARKYLARIDLE